MEKPALEPQVVLTADGSHSLYVAALKETYHSHHGALQESAYVYIEQGLARVAAQGTDAISVFELGFGTGLNACLTAIFAERHKRYVHLTSIEKHPVSLEVLRGLNYAELPGLKEHSGMIQRIIQAHWNEQVPCGEYFTLRKVEADMHSLKPEPQTYHCLYFDAFGYRAQPDLWSSEVFQTCYKLLKPNGILVTYASLGSARRAMQAVGFEVSKLPGAPGKREMMLARKVT